MAGDQIGTKALVDCSVAAADIAPGTITSAKLAGSIANAKLSNSSITVNGTATALGGSVSAGSLAWQSVIVSDGSTVTTMVAGRGYFVDNTSAAGIVKLPISASAGDTVAIKDYAANFATNNLTIQRNGHNIQGVANDSVINTNKASVQLVYIDATKGWLYTNESNVADLIPPFIVATGGTITTSGDFKIHSFTGDGTFAISSAPTPANNNVDYLVIAGGGSGGRAHGGGGGAGGYRESSGAASGCYTRSPLGACVAALPVTATSYPVTVGAGGAAPTSSPDFKGARGSNSVFSTITSTGGGNGSTESTTNSTGPGGSGGGGTYAPNPGTTPGGAGNTPPVSPSQGNPGGQGGWPGQQGGGGGGAGGAGTGAPGSYPAPKGPRVGGNGAAN